MDPIYLAEDAKEELDSASYRLTQSESELETARENDLQLYLSALSPADIADFYWSDQPVHDEDPVVAAVDDFTGKEGGDGTFFAVVQRS